MLRRKAQTSMMEYIMVTFFMMIIIVVMVMMFIGIQVVNISSETSQQKSDRSLALMKAFSKTPFFTKDNGITENPIFYDKKLTVALLKEVEFCNDMKKIFGERWSLDITVIDGEILEVCDWDDYNNCNSWILCEDSQYGDGILIREIPISLYRDYNDKIEPALMRVKTYV